MPPLDCEGLTSYDNVFVGGDEVKLDFDMIDNWNKELKKTRERCKRGEGSYAFKPQPAPDKLIAKALDTV